MNVTCPDCTTTYRVDPAKVPSGGVLARCARCPGIFHVTGITPDRWEADSAAADAARATALEGDLVASSGRSADEAVDSGGASESGLGSQSTWSDAPPTGGDAPSATSQGRQDSDHEPVQEEPDVEEVEYAGASDVEFHTEGAVLEDLPYLEASGAASAENRLDIPPATTDPEESGRPSGSEESVASDPDRALETSSESAESPGETPLPPAPFGARSDPHRRAARLARALVSDIVVYHPERRTRSLRQGTLRQEFREEIRKSWEEYANQVGSDFARQTTYFRDALNEILAEGATVF